MELKQTRGNRRQQPAQLTRDDASRLCASAINAVLAKLSLSHIVEGIAVLPAGEGVWQIDIVMRDLAEQDTWALTLTIPPSQEATDTQD